MPALVLFGRRWLVASDDFVIPTFADLLYRLAWLIAVAIVYLKNDEHLGIECKEEFHIKMYLYGILAILQLIVFIDIALIHNSKSGSILEQEERKYVPFCLYMRCFSQIIEVAWTAIGTYGMFHGVLVCSAATDVKYLMAGIILSNWMLALIVIILLFLSYDSIGRYKYKVEDNGIVDPKFTKEWKKKFRSLSCFYSGSKVLKNEAFEEAGYLFASIFEDVDVVPTDVIAGFMALAMKNALIKKNELKKVISTEGKTRLPIKEEIEWPKMEKWNSVPVLYQLKKYAVAAYSWPLATIAHSSPIKNLWKNSFCCGCLPGRNHPVEVTGDNCCFLKTSGVKTLTQLENDDIVYASFKNPVFENPFFIALDHPTKSVVVAIRGTLSIDDALTDLNAKPYPLEIPGLPDSFKGHHGMVRCSRKLKEKLESLKILPKLFTTHPDYNLVLTGTSLGAGTATILGMMMKGQYPDLKCYAYAPPGWLLSLEAAQYCEDFVLSVVYGDDLVARIGIESVEILKYQIMEVLNDCRTPKYQILLKEFYWLCGGFPKLSFGDKTNGEKSKLKTKQLTPQKSDATVINLETNQEENMDTNMKKKIFSKYPVPEVKKLQNFETLYPPGNILYITETESFKAGRKKQVSEDEPRWSIQWVHRSEFRDLHVTSRMVLDHIPFRMYKALRDLTLRYNDNFECDLKTSNSSVIPYVFKSKSKS